MIDYYADAAKNVAQLPRLLSRAYFLDQKEVALSLQMAASMGLVGAAGSAAAMAAQASASAALARATSSLAQIRGILMWASESSHLPTTFQTREVGWRKLGTDVDEIRERMLEVQGHGLQNQWTGQAKDQWKQFTDHQIEEHEAFDEATKKIAPLTKDAMQVAQHFLMGFALHARKASALCATAASRALMPNPMGLGIATRTPMVAGHLQTCAVEFLQHKDGLWKVEAAELASEFQQVAAEIRASAERSKL